MKRSVWTDVATVFWCDVRTAAAAPSPPKTFWPDLVFVIDGTTIANLAKMRKIANMIRWR